MRLASLALAHRITRMNANKNFDIMGFVILYFAANVAVPKVISQRSLQRSFMDLWTFGRYGFLKIWNL